jgi:hypothetical protein
MTTRPSFEVHIDTRLLYQRLVASQIGETVTYADLSETISREVVGADSNLQSALRRAFRDDNMVFSNIAKIGYKRLDDGEIVKSSSNDVSGLRRKAKKSSERLFKVKDYAGLSDAARISHATNASIFGAVSAFLTPRGIKAVQSGVTARGAELPVAETIKLFSKD